MPTVGRAIKLPTFGEIPASVDRATAEMLNDIVMLLDIAYGRQGKGTNSRFVTIQDLVNAGLVADGVIK